MDNRLAGAEGLQQHGRAGRPTASWFFGARLGGEEHLSPTFCIGVEGKLRSATSLEEGHPKTVFPLLELDLLFLHLHAMDPVVIDF